MLGCIAVGRSRWYARFGRNGMSAGVAELGRGREGRPAVRAGPGQRGRALFAEARPLRVLVLAPGTLHVEPPVDRAGRWGRATVARGSGARQCARIQAGLTNAVPQRPAAILPP